MWARVVARRGRAPSRPLLAAVLLVVGLLLVQIVLGIPLWVEAGVPGMNLRAPAHAGGPVVALIIALGLVADGERRSAGHQALAMLAIAGAALLSFAVRLVV